jgi:hypothetical protein
VHIDRLVWKFEHNDIYSVRSAYKYCVNNAGSQHRIGITGNWNIIWQAKIPPKVNNLQRRIGRNVLPTRATLNNHGVQCPLHCAVCNYMEEDSLHVLFLCSRSIDRWQQAGLWNHISAGLNISSNITDNLFSILQNLDKEQQELFSVMVWSIWKRRNNQVWDNVADSNRTVCERARHLITSWRQAQHIRSHVSNQQPAPQQMHWLKPSPGRYKCNIDASFSSISNKVGIGMCIRDAHGSFVAARTKWIEPILDVEIGEAIGLLSALR